MGNQTSKPSKPLPAFNAKVPFVPKPRHPHDMKAEQLARAGKAFSANDFAKCAEHIARSYLAGLFAVCNVFNIKDNETTHLDEWKQYTSTTLTYKYFTDAVDDACIIKIAFDTAVGTQRFSFKIVKTLA